MAKNSEKKKMNFLLLLPILAIVFVSGCTFPGGGTDTSKGPGVVIKSFIPELDNVRSNEEVNLRGEIQNQGEARARNVVAELINIDVNEWGGFGTIAFQNLGDLLPFDPVAKTPGQTKQVAFTKLRAPSLPKNVQFTYEPTLRISYDYSTSTIKPISAIDADELTNIRLRGGTLPTKPTQFTAGPLSVDIKTGDFVTTQDQFGTTYDIFPVNIRIDNTQWASGGTVEPEVLAIGQERYPVRVKIEPPSWATFVFTGFSGSQDCGSFLTVDLFRGSNAEITCELQVISPPTVRTEGQIKVDLEYRYHIDKPTQIRVTGTQPAGSLF